MNAAPMPFTLMSGVSASSTIDAAPDWAGAVDWRAPLPPGDLHQPDPGDFRDPPPGRRTCCGALLFYPAFVPWTFQDQRAEPPAIIHGIGVRSLFRGGGGLDVYTA